MAVTTYPVLGRILVTSVALVALDHGAHAAESAQSADIEAVLGGTWQFSTVGTTAGMSSHPQEYTQQRRVHFVNGRFDTNPLGFASQGFRLVACEAGGPVKFETPYGIGGGNYSMLFTGSGDDNLTHLSGHFEFCMASGTFTAIHEAAEAESLKLTVAIGHTAAARIRLTLKPDAPISVHGLRVHGDRHLAVAAAVLNFTPDTWDQSQDLVIDASAVTTPGRALIGVVGAGVPETFVAVTLLRPAASAHEPTGGATGSLPGGTGSRVRG